MLTIVCVLHFHKLQGSCQNSYKILTTWPAGQDLLDDLQVTDQQQQQQQQNTVYNTHTLALFPGHLGTKFRPQFCHLQYIQKAKSTACNKAVGGGLGRRLHAPGISSKHDFGLL